MGMLVLSETSQPTLSGNHPLPWCAGLEHISKVPVKFSSHFGVVMNELLSLSLLESIEEKCGG